MRIIAKRTLRAFWQKHPDARGPLEAWHAEVKKADWAGPRDVKKRYRAASFLGDNRIAFNIGGNKYRLVVKVNYFYKIVYIRFAGTHAEYDRIDVGQV